jgi:hypothetical protein
MWSGAVNVLISGGFSSAYEECHANGFAFIPKSKPCPQRLT